MIFRTDKNAPRPTAEQMPAILKAWEDWNGGIAAQNKFIASNALGRQGVLMNREGVITDGPYAEVKEIVGGYTLVKADDFEDAKRMAEGCPIYAAGGTVEVRDIMIFD